MRVRRTASMFPVLLAAAALMPLQAATLLVANKSDDTVDLFDLASGKSTATLPTGKAPHEVSVSPDGKLAVVSNYGARDHAGSTLTVIDIRKAEVARTVDLDDHTRPHGLAWTPKGHLVLTTEGSAQLLIIDPQQGEILETVETGRRISHMVAVTPDGKRAFVANIGSANVTVIDLVRYEKLTDITTGRGAEGIAITPDGKQVWVSNRGDDTISVIDPESLEVVATLECPGFPIRIVFTPNGKRALVTCAEAGEISVFDVAERTELERRKIDLQNAPDAATRLFGDRFGDSPVPVGIVIAPDGKTAWVAATQADAVVVLDPSTLEIKALLQAGREPDGMAYSVLDVAPPAPSGAKSER